MTKTDSYRLNSPVVLTLFSRPELVREVFNRIRSARPPKLFLISDAGRTPNEDEKVRMSQAIAEAVDWPCEVFKNYSDKNMGAKMRLATGITWVFEHVDRAIILEHDCLPDPTFFRFCEDLLEKYKDDERVMHISGDNVQQGNPSFKCPESYYFSIVPHTWGWATWARAWKHYDVNIRLWPQAKKERWLENVFEDSAVLERWEYRFEQYYRGEAQSWDGQWAFACFINSGLSINPRVNMVSNIGFGPEALNTKNPEDEGANVPAFPLPFPLVHPHAILPNRASDAYSFRYAFHINRYHKERIRWFLKSNFPLGYRFLKKVYQIFAGF
jgi:hypothetical protein